jgi:hypothetical protein
MRRLFLAVTIATVLAAQASGSPPSKSESPLAKAAAALPFRSIGLSLMSGRLADIGQSHRSGYLVPGRRLGWGLEDHQRRLHVWGSSAEGPARGSGSPTTTARPGAG